jgi:hypothetical protein
MLSLSLDGNYFVNTENDYLKFDELLGKGESPYDIGYSYFGHSLSGATSINGTPYYNITGSWSPIGLDYGGAVWDTYTTPLIIDGSLSPINTIMNFFLIKDAFNRIKQ